MYFRHSYMQTFDLIHVSLILYNTPKNVFIRAVSIKRCLQIAKMGSFLVIYNFCKIIWNDPNTPCFLRIAKYQHRNFLRTLLTNIDHFTFRLNSTVMLLCYYAVS